MGKILWNQGKFVVNCFHSVCVTDAKLSLEPYIMII